MDNPIEDKRARIDYIDTYRGIGILLMIMGHVGFGAEFNHWIHGFHMPLFFFLSGYLHNNRYDEKQSIIKYFFYNCKKNAKRLLIPYLIWGTFHLVIYAIFNRNISLIRDAAISFVWNNTSDSFPYAGALWFLTALFLCLCIYHTIDCIKNDYLKCVIVIIITAIGLILKEVLNITLPYGCNASFVGIGFFHLGYIIKKRNIMKHISLIFALITIVPVSIIIFVNDYVNMRLGIYGYFFLFGVSSVAMCVIIWKINCSVIKYLPTTIKNMLCIMGEDSLVFLCFNEILIYGLLYLIKPFVSVALIRSIIILVLVLVVLFFMRYLVKKLNCYFLFGK